MFRSNSPKWQHHIMRTKFVPPSIYTQRTLLSSMEFFGTTYQAHDRLQTRLPRRRVQGNGRESNTSPIESTHRCSRRLICGVAWANYKWNRLDREPQGLGETRVRRGGFHTWPRCVRSAALCGAFVCAGAAFIRANKCEEERKERKKE